MMKAYYIDQNRCIEIKGFGIVCRAIYGTAMLGVVQMVAAAIGCSTTLAGVLTTMVEIATRE